MGTVNVPEGSDGFPGVFGSSSWRWTDFGLCLIACPVHVVCCSKVFVGFPWVLCGDAVYLGVTLRGCSCGGVSFTTFERLSPGLFL